MDKTSEATIVISTFNRKDALRVALRSAVTQDIPVEIIVMDDGSTDGTADMVRSEFPTVAFYRSEENKGYVSQRTRGAFLASAPVIVSIDDDAEFSDPSIVRETLREFTDEKIGAVAMPFINVHRGGELLQRAPGPGQWVTSEYVGTAHALRKDVFSALKGYREVLYHQGEEADYCLRMLQAGYFVRLGSAKPILHYVSNKRDSPKIVFFTARNCILFIWHNTPWMILPIHVFATILNVFIYHVRRAYLGKAMAGVLKGLQMVFIGSVVRDPVSWTAYRIYRYLKRRGSVELSNMATLAGKGFTVAAVRERR